MINCLKSLTSFATILAATIGIGETAVQALTFNFSSAPGTPQQAIEGLIAAGNLWSELFVDDVTVDLGFRFTFEPPGAASTLFDFSYEQVRNALLLDQTSTADATALSNLQSGSALNLLINLTRDNPSGSGSVIPYLDNNGSANNTTIRTTATNAKALGLNRADAKAVNVFLGGDLSRDAVIILDPSWLWDFDRTDGISSGYVDFIGIVAHEIGHLMGFSSGVDILDRSNFVPAEDNLTWINTLDLFRFSSDSVAFGKGTIDWTASRTDKYFSIDGGVTRTANFGTGIFNGDGIFPGHWQSLGTGIMDGYLTPFIGQKAQISSIDITALDVIGWDTIENIKSVSSVPEPSSALGVLAFGALGAVTVLKRKQKLASGVKSIQRLS